MTKDVAELRTIAETIKRNGGWHIAAIKVRAAADELEWLRAELVIVTKDRDTLLQTFGSNTKSVAKRLVAQMRPDEPGGGA